MYNIYKLLETVTYQFTNIQSLGVLHSFYPLASHAPLVAVMLSPGGGSTYWREDSAHSGLATIIKEHRISEDYIN